MNDVAHRAEAHDENSEQRRVRLQIARRRLMILRRYGSAHFQRAPPRGRLELIQQLGSRMILGIANDLDASAIGQTSSRSGTLSRV